MEHAGHKLSCPDHWDQHLQSIITMKHPRWSHSSSKLHHISPASLGVPFLAQRASPDAWGRKSRAVGKSIRVICSVGRPARDAGEIVVARQCSVPAGARDPERAGVYISFQIYPVPFEATSRLIAYRLFPEVMMGIIQRAKLRASQKWTNQRYLSEGHTFPSTIE